MRTVDEINADYSKACGTIGDLVFKKEQLDLEIKRLIGAQMNLMAEASEVARFNDALAKATVPAVPNEAEIKADALLEKRK